MTSDGVTTFDATSPPVTVTIPGECLICMYTHCAINFVLLPNIEDLNTYQNACHAGTVVFHTYSNYVFVSKQPIFIQCSVCVNLKDTPFLYWLLPSAVPPVTTARPTIPTTQPSFNTTGPPGVTTTLAPGVIVTIILVCIILCTCTTCGVAIVITSCILPQKEGGIRRKKYKRRSTEEANSFTHQRFYNHELADFEPRPYRAGKWSPGDPSQPGIWADQEPLPVSSMRMAACCSLVACCALVNCLPQSSLPT